MSSDQLLTDLWRKSQLLSFLTWLDWKGSFRFFVCVAVVFEKTRKQKLELCFRLDHNCGCGAEIRTLDGRVGSTNAHFVLCRPIKRSGSNFHHVFVLRQWPKTKELLELLLLLLLLFSICLISSLKEIKVKKSPWPEIKPGSSGATAKHSIKWAAATLFR